MSESEKKELATPSRDSIRAGIFNAAKVKSKRMTFFGQEVEVKQPTLEEVLSAQQNEDRQAAMIEMLIARTFVPNSNVKVFESADADALRKLPFAGDMIAMSKAFEELSEVNFLDGGSA